MKMSKEELSKKLNIFLQKTIRENKEYKKLIERINRKYNIPSMLLSDVLFMRKEIIDQSDYVLFCILNCLVGSDLDKKHILGFKLNDVFTDNEIEEFNRIKYKPEKINKIKFKMVEIEEDKQWIGGCDTADLIKLRDAQLISYNENTQRPLVRKTLDGVDIYTIAINRKQVNSIMESFKENMYIPNTLTFNIPKDAVVKYDGTYLTISEFDSLDIIDGYHRYLAISNSYNLDDKFSYPMEIRMVRFAETKAQQFIWQEDQKTKMKKMVSETFNQSNPANIIVSDLNEEKLLYNCITKDAKIIDSSFMALLLKIIYFDNKNVKRSEITNVKNELLEKFKSIINQNNSILDEKWNNKYLLSFLFLCKEGVNNNILYEKTEELYSEIIKPEYKDVIVANSQFRKLHYTRLKKIYESL